MEAERRKEEVKERETKGQGKEEQQQEAEEKERKDSIQRNNREKGRERENWNPGLENWGNERSKVAGKAMKGARLLEEQRWWRE